MTLDSHQHFWRYEPKQYPWILPGTQLQRDWLPEDLKPHLSTAGVDGCIAVQARQSLEESRWLIELAASNPFIKAVVGWVDLRSAHVTEQLKELAYHSVLRGVRHVVQDEPDDAFMVSPEFQRGISRLLDFDLVYDILIYPHQLSAAIELVRRNPHQRFVIDHAAKPPIKTRALSPWREHMRQISAYPNVCCKISGMVTEADWDSWNLSDIQPYLDLVFDAFGPSRIMYGSDWPVCLLAASYGRQINLVLDYTARFSVEERDAIFGGNAQRFYGLGTR